MAPIIADCLVPEWIRRIGKDKKVNTTNLEDARRWEALEKALLKSEGPALAERVFKELTFQVIACENIGIRGVINSISRDDGEKAFRVEISAKSPWPKNSYTDIHYVSGDASIRCYPRDSALFVLELTPDKTGELVILSNGGQITSPEQAAKLILAPLVQDVIS